MVAVAYIRMSTTQQDLEKNKTDILLLANDKKLGHVDFVLETASGTLSWKKRKIAKIIEELEEGDSLIVSELSRIGRSMLEIMQVLAIAIEKGIHVYAVKGNWQLDNSIQSKIMAMVFAMAAEIERDFISSRTKETLRVKKAAGMKLGRPKGPGKSKLDPDKAAIEKMLNDGSTQKFIAHRYNTTEANLSLWMKKHGLKRKSL